MRFYKFGITASLIYIFTVIIGGLLWPGYSHVRQAISELSMANSPNQIIIQPLFWLYNLLLLGFSVGLFFNSKKRLLKIAAIFLGLCGIGGILMYFFPQDPMNTQLTTKGLVHLILAGIESISTLIAIFTAAFGIIKIKKVSIILGLTIFVFGPMTAMAPTYFPNIFGVFERITIGTFIVWLLYFSYSIKNIDTIVI